MLNQLLSDIINRIKVYVSIDAMKSFYNDKEKLVKSSIASYIAAVNAFMVNKAQSSGTSAYQEYRARKSAEDYKNSRLSIDQLSADIGKTSATTAMPQTADTDTTDSEIILYFDYNNQKMKFNSIEELYKTILSIDSIIRTASPATMREWRHILSSQPREIAELTKGTVLLSKVSEEAGSTYLEHNVDTQNLLLGSWGNGAPQSVRKILKQKLDSNVSNLIDVAYTNLNRQMLFNISREFADDNRPTNSIDASSDYHVIGDVNFPYKVLPRLYTQLYTAILDVLSDKAKLINWISPVKSSHFVYNNQLKVTIEGNEIIIDQKGNKLATIATILDKSPIEDK